jgi:hypothetical protein
MTGLLTAYCQWMDAHTAPLAINLSNQGPLLISQGRR